MNVLSLHSPGDRGKPRRILKIACCPVEIQNEYLTNTIPERYYYFILLGCLYIWKWKRPGYHSDARKWGFRRSNDRIKCELQNKLRFARQASDYSSWNQPSVGNSWQNSKQLGLQPRDMFYRVITMSSYEFLLPSHMKK